MVRALTMSSFSASGSHSERTCGQHIELYEFNLDLLSGSLAELLGRLPPNIPFINNYHSV